MSKAEEAGYDAPPPAYPASAPGQGPPPPTGPGYPQPPPPAGYAYQPGQTTVVTTQPTVIQAISFRESPVVMVCPHCQAQVTTSVHYETGTFTWLIAGVICLVGCWLGCCLIPFCVDSLKEAIHTCPNCNRQVGRYSRM